MPPPGWLRSQDDQVGKIGRVVSDRRFSSPRSEGMTRHADMRLFEIAESLVAQRIAPALARRCVVVEKREHPRHKLCGGGLVSDVDTILDNLGLDLSEVPQVDAQWACLNFAGRGLRMKLRDIAFHGQGCAICIASASMMSEAVIGRERAAVQALQQRFRAVLTGGREPEAAELGKLISLAGVRRYPARVKCALLAWHALAQAIGAEDAHGRRACAYGDIGCTSFYPSKNLSAFGDGGLVITDSDVLAAELRVLAGHFMTIPQAMGVPKGRTAAARYVRDFVEQAKASGFVGRSLRSHGLGPDDAIVAPAAGVVLYDGEPSSDGSGYLGAEEAVERFAAAAGCDVDAAEVGTPLDLDDSLAGLRITTRDPRTLLLLSRRAL